MSFEALQGYLSASALVPLLICYKVKALAQLEEQDLFLGGIPPMATLGSCLHAIQK
jgi:hypothetical protein